MTSLSVLEIQTIRLEWVLDRRGGGPVGTKMEYVC